MEIPDNIPDTGAVFAFGNSKFADNRASCFWLKNDVITSISCGDEHTALITEAGKLYVFGSNDWGQLGLGHTHPVNKPTCLKSLKVHKSTMVACGRNHTLVCTETGKLFAFGNNSDSQLGVDDIDSSNVPIQVNTANIGSIKQIGAGADFSVLLTDVGDVYAWGSNVEGQLGLGSETNEAIKPTLIKSLDSSVYIACGYYHMAVVTEQGALYTFGEDEYGKLGDREIDDTSVPSKVSLSSSVQVAKVACGGSHTAFVSKDGSLYTIGDGSHGELGHGENISQVSKPKLVERLTGHHVIHVSCGENFTAAITKKGRIYTFGDGRHGKLALDEENFTNQFKPFRCSRFNDFNVKFAECGGCHMIVSAAHGHSSPDDIESEDEDPMQTFVGKKVDQSISISHELNGGVDNTTLETGEKIVNLSRSLSAREKRRKDRGNSLSKTLPPLRTLKPYELIEAAKTLPKPVTTQQHNSFSNEWSHVSKNKRVEAEEPDIVSEISAFNKVHVLQEVGDINTLTPVHTKPKKKIEPTGSPKVNGKEEVKKTTEVTPVSPIQENKDTSIVQEIPPEATEEEDSMSEEDEDEDDREDADDEDELTEEDETGDEEDSPVVENKEQVIDVQKDESSTVSHPKEPEKKEEKQVNEKTQKQKKGIFNFFKREKKDNTTEPTKSSLDNTKKESAPAKTVDSADVPANAENVPKPSTSAEPTTSNLTPKDEVPTPAAAPPKVDDAQANTLAKTKNTDESETKEQSQSEEATTSDSKSPPLTTEDKTTTGGNPTVPKKQKSKFCIIL